jgi:hypothetical protein
MSNYNPYTAAFAALTNSQARQFYAQTAREHSQIVRASGDLLESSLVNAMTLCLIVIRLGQLTREFIEWQKREEPSPRLLPSKNRNLQNLNGKTRTVQVLSLPPAATPIALLPEISRRTVRRVDPLSADTSAAPRPTLITPAPQVDDNYWASDDREEFLPSIAQRQVECVDLAQVAAAALQLEASIQAPRIYQSYTLLTIRQLKAIARDRKLAGYGRMTKAQLVEALSR